MQKKSKDPVRALLWRQRLSKTAYYAWMYRRRVVADAETPRTILVEQPPPEVNLGRFLRIAPDKRFELFDYTVLASWRWRCHGCKLRKEATSSRMQRCQRRGLFEDTSRRYEDTFRIQIRACHEPRVSHELSLVSVSFTQHNTGSGNQAGQGVKPTSSSIYRRC